MRSTSVGEMVLSALKRAVTRKLERVGATLGKVASPNALTLSAMMLGLLAGVVLAGVFELGENSVPLALVLIILSGLMDMLDGLVARATQRTSRVGAFLDSTCDRVVDAAVLIGLGVGGYVGWVPVSLALALSMLTSYVKSRAETLGADLSGVGVLERPERILLIVAILFAYCIFGSRLILEYGIWLFVVLAAITVVQRTLSAVTQLRCLDSKLEDSERR